MEMQELLTFIDKISDKLSEHYATNETETKCRAALKVSEEAGELAGEALKHLGFQRQEKLDAMDSKELGKEMADVIFSTMIMAKRFNVDILEAMNNKIEIIKGRFNLK